MKIKIVTPYKIIEYKDAKLMVFKTVEGEMGVLDKRAPIIAKLAVSDIRIKTETSEEILKVIDGFLHCDGESNVIVLTEDVGKPQDFDPHKFSEQ
ncbi:F0F1 ATP synthase subunit epsilon [Fervidobacterium sp.]